MNLRLFVLALLCKSLWRAVFGKSLWSQAIRMKYLGNKDVYYWYRNRFMWPSQELAIWRSFQKVLPFFYKNIIWKLQTGNSALIRFDAIMGVEMDPPIAPQLLSILHQKGLFYWAQVIKEWKEAIPQWKSNRELGLEGTTAAQWNKIIWTMKNAGIYKTEDSDSIVWQVKKGRSNVLVRDIYLSMIEQRRETSQKLFPYSLWKAGCPLKITLFSWLVYHNKNLTWANLQKKSRHGPAICIIYLSDAEDNMHIFLKCPLTQNLRKRMASYFGFPEISHPSIIDAYEWWGSQKIIRRPIPLIVIWFIWKWRNNKIFQNNKEEFGHIFDKIIPFYFAILPNIPQQMKHQNTVSDSQQRFFPQAHFDGAAKEGKCACGVYIGISNELQYFMFWNGGNGTNNKAEAMALPIYMVTPK